MATIERIRPLLEQGYSYNEIGGCLGISRNAVAGIIHRSGIRKDLFKPKRPQPAAAARPHCQHVDSCRAKGNGHCHSCYVAAANAVGRQAAHAAWRNPERRAALVVAVKNGWERKKQAEAAAATIGVPAVGSVDFAGLTDSTCRWPYGDEPPFMFCGEPAAFEMRGGKLKQRPYCSGHCAKAFDGFGRGARAGERVRQEAR